MHRFVRSLILGIGLLVPLSQLGSAQDFSFGPPAGMSADPSVQNVKTGAEASVETYNTDPFYIVAKLELPKGWHSYYKNPGSVGIPTTSTIEKVNGFEIEGPFFSIPSVDHSELGYSYGYSEVRVAYKVIPQASAPAEATFAPSITWQMCRDGQCMPDETRTMPVTLKKGTGASTSDPNLLAGIIGISNPEWSRTITSTYFTQEGKKITLNFITSEPSPFPKANAYFFCDDGQILPSAPQTWKEVSPTHFQLELTYNDGSDFMYLNSLNADGKNKEPITFLNGILRFNNEVALIKAKPESALSATSTSANETISAETVEEETSLGLILVYMFFGGMILNIMPCVFPVIGLKIMGFVQMAGGSRRKILEHSLTFVLGVLVSFWVISIIILILKNSLTSADQQVGWAFWLENPWVIYTLLFFMLAMALSMFGVFEIGVGATAVGSDLQHKKGYAGSFWSGVLATLVSTPCSGPLLGPTIAYSMGLSNTLLIVAFTCMGLGMSAPYIILGSFPSLINKLPKPGAWMEAFKQGISFLLFGTCAYFVWVYMAYFDQETSPTSILTLFFGIVSFICGWWIYGRWCGMYLKKSTRFWGALFTVIFLAGGLYLAVPPSSQEDTAADTGENLTLAWETWSPEAMQKALDEGKPVYVDFTARWCMTCIANKLVYQNDEVKKTLLDHNIILMKADKTKPNPEIDKELKSLNRSAIPVNALYQAGKAPAITQEILTPEYLVNFINDQMKD